MSASWSICWKKSLKRQRQRSNQMKRRFGRQRPENRAATPVILLWGDAQAEAAAVVLRALPAISTAYDVVYCDARRNGDAPPREVIAACAHSFEQHGREASYVSRLPRGCKRTSFPALRFRLLWPLAAPNPFNRPEPANPAGAFPWGDSFITACLKRGMPADEIMRFYQSSTWHASWPSLDELFKRESLDLSTADAKCDVKIGSFILKHFRKTRLFWSANAPTDRLLSELVYRLLHAAFGPRPDMERDSVQAVLAARGGQDLLGRVAAPIHPLVARHFSLEWYDPQEKYASFNGEDRTFGEYYRDMIAHSTAR